MTLMFRCKFAFAFYSPVTIQTYIYTTTQPNDKSNNNKIKKIIGENNQVGHKKSYLHADIRILYTIISLVQIRSMYIYTYEIMKNKHNIS